MTGNFPIKLKSNEINSFKNGFDELSFHSEEELLQEFNHIEQECTYPPKNPTYRDWTKEQCLSHLFPKYDILCYWYYLALSKNNPGLLLNGYFTYNHLNSIFTLATGVDHCDRIRPVLECYAGNNFELLDKYLPSDLELSKKGHRFSVTAINLILSIKNDLKKQEVLNQANNYLQKKNPKLDTAIIQTLKAILEQNIEMVSKHLSIVTNLHKSSRWLHDFYNPIGKYLPFVSYALYTMAYQHNGAHFAQNISIPKSNIWWTDFTNQNINDEFSEGQDILDFPDKFKFINVIHRQPSIYKWL